MISCRSTAGFLVWRREAQTVIAGAVGCRLDRQRQRCRGCYRLSRGGIALPRQDIEHDVAAEQLGRQRLGTRRFDCIEPAPGHSRQDVDELAIAVVMPGEPAPNLRQCRRQIPVAERIAVTQRPRLACQYWQIMPGIVGGLATTKAAAVLRDNLAVAPDDDALGVN